jgi:hypothetical protein
MGMRDFRNAGGRTSGSQPTQLSLEQNSSGECSVERPSGSAVPRPLPSAAVSPVTHPAHQSTPPRPLPVPGAAMAVTATGRPLDALAHSALLEAVRSLDAPTTDLELELFDELRNKRLGLTDTVLAQARRYADAARRGQRLSFAEGAALSRLIYRRPDAEAVFREAGRYLAETAISRVGGLVRALAKRAPRAVSRPMALRQAHRIAKRYLDGAVRREGSAVLLEVSKPVTIDDGSGEQGCAFYEVAFRTVLEGLGQDVGGIDRVNCRTRGDRLCAWRTEWKR